jgi:hypothetical protein
MKYIKLFENFDSSEIDDICKEYGIRNYTINSDGSIDVEDDVDLLSGYLTKLPLKFNKVYGSFDCGNNKLTTLEGSPNYVGDNFNCSDNELTNLIGGPKEVGGWFDCSDNKLTSLDGCPKEVICGFHCADNKLTTLEGCPNTDGFFNDCDNPISKITDLFDFEVKYYLEYQETYNFVRKDCKIVRHLLEEALKDFNEYYKKQVKLPEKIEGYTYI